MLSVKEGIMRIKKSGVYQIVNEINGKTYIGSSKDIELRWAKHRYDCKKPPKYRSILRDAIRKHGIENFTFIIIEECECIKKTLLVLEQHYIDTTKPEYNILPTVGSRLGSKGLEPRSQEVRDKISRGNKGLKRTEEYCLRISEVRKNISDDTRNKMAQSKIGTVRSEQTREKMSQSHIGLERTFEHVENNIQSRHRNRLERLSKLTSTVTRPNDVKLALRRLTEEQVLFIRASELTDTMVGQQLGFSPTTIARIRRRQTYKDIP